MTTRRIQRLKPPDSGLVASSLDIKANVRTGHLRDVAPGSG